MPSVSEIGEEAWRVIPVAARFLRRNATRTMAGSVVRALVELITNARDSAYRLLAAGGVTPADLLKRAVQVEYVVSGADGKRLVVRDRFEGMTAEIMSERLLRYGVGAASGFQTGAYVRGINARGAKDVGALGRVRFECIRDGMFAECEIYNGMERGPTTRPCTDADRERMGLGTGNGTVVTLFPDTTVSIPAFDALARDLEHHIELRYHPEEQPSIPIKFREIRQGRSGSEREIGGFAPHGEVIVDETIPLPEWTRYGASEGALRVFRSAEPLAPLGSRATMTRLWRSEAGILVTDGRTAHDITFFFARGSDDVAARYLFGELYLPQITGLLREYDEIEERRDSGEAVDFDELNPYQVTDPDRLGLNREHPFVQAVEEKVRPLIEAVLKQVEEDLAPPAQQRVGQELREALDRLGEQLAAKLEVIDTGTERGQRIRWGLSAVPPGLRVELGKSRRVTVYYRVEPDVAPSAVVCRVVADSPAIQASATEITLNPVPEKAGVFRGSFEVAGLTLTDLAPVQLFAEDKDALVKVSVREPATGEIELDRDLQFSQRHYSSLPGRRKKIEIFADPVLADHIVEVSLAADAVALSATSIQLEYDFGRGVAVASFYVESAGPATDRMIARCGELEDEAVIVFQDFAARPKIDFQIRDNESWGGRRFRWDPQDNNRVLIAGGHPSISRVLGPKQGGEGAHAWPGQWTPQTRAILAELIADAFVYRKLQEAAPMLDFEGGLDSVDYDNMRYQYFEEVYLICHEALTPAYEEGA